MNIPDAQGETLAKLVGLGFKMTYFHHDGVIDTARDINGQRVRIFICDDGTCRPPRTEETMLASADLVNAGIIVKTAADHKE